MSELRGYGMRGAGLADGFDRSIQHYSSFLFVYNSTPHKSNCISREYKVIEFIFSLLSIDHDTLSQQQHTKTP